jgi:hypothetical protein
MNSIIKSLPELYTKVSKWIKTPSDNYKPNSKVTNCASYIIGCIGCTIAAFGATFTCGAIAHVFTMPLGLGIGIPTVAIGAILALVGYILIRD